MSLVAADMLSPLRVDPTNFGSPRQVLRMNIALDNGGPIIPELQLSCDAFLRRLSLELTTRHR